MQFVYKCSLDYSDYGYGQIETIYPHLIIKKTPKRIYIDRHISIGKTGHRKATGVITHQRLTCWIGKSSNQLGRRSQVSIPVTTPITVHPTYSVERWSRTGDVPEWAEGLGVSPDATEEEQSAYKRQAIKHHPDMGGDPAMFKRNSRVV